MSNINYSFIIPHKNRPDLLLRCINTIPRRKDVQIIIVDDNSDSDIVDFEHFPGINEECVEVYFTKEGRGAGYARNVGLKYAQGNWLLFADADDYYASNFIEILDEKLSEDLDILYFNVFSNDCTIYNRAIAINEIYQLYFESHDEEIIKYKVWAPWNKVISLRLINKYHLKFDEIPVGNDAIFMLQASRLACNVKVILEKLYCITYQTDSITYRKMTFERQLSYAKINLRINNFFQKNHLSKYQITIISPKFILSLVKEYGFINTFEYLRYVNQKDNLIHLFYIWFRRKYLM